MLCPVLKTRYGREPPPTSPTQEAGERFEQKKVCSNPLQREVRARRIYILTRLTTAREEKRRCGGEQAGNTWNRRRAVVPGFRVNLCVCVYVQKHAWWVSVPPCCVSPPLALCIGLYFRSPSSPWMVFLMRSSSVVCHWSRREMESNSFTCGGTEKKKCNDQSFVSCSKSRTLEAYIVPSRTGCKIGHLTKFRSYRGKLIKWLYSVKFSLSDVQRISYEKNK